VLRPLPVDCWDWTGGLRAFASARAISGNTLRRVLPGGWGARASGLSHLTYDTTGTIILHRLDQPPFPCKLKILRRRLPSQGPLLTPAGPGPRGSASSPVPKCEGPVAPSSWFGKITGTGATRPLLTPAGPGPRGSASSPVPKCEGPVAPSSWFEKITGTGATRRRC